MATLMQICSKLNRLFYPRTNANILMVPGRTVSKFNHYPIKRYPEWFVKQHRVLYKEEITDENKKFVQETIEEKYGIPDQSGSYSPLKLTPIEPIVTKPGPHSRRTGVIAKKIGVYPMWLKNGKKVTTTLLHVCDNHVIKYIPPEEWEPKIGARKFRIPKIRRGCLLVGAESVDPQMFTKEYCGLFTNAGVMPKRMLARFSISADAALQPGTSLSVAHFKPGQVIDIRGKTIDRGFQGVMKRWGFKGMPASHGVTKTHRRPGNIGFGSGKARVLPGTKLPGHMGNRYRIQKGVRILRINTKYNVMWVLGHNIPGETNNFCQIYDSIFKFKEPIEPYFPTYIQSDQVLQEEIYADDVHRFESPTIEFELEKDYL